MAVLPAEYGIDVTGMGRLLIDAISQRDYPVIQGVTVVVGIGVMLGKTWARVLGIVVAAISALANLTFIAAYPLWCTIVIAGTSRAVGSA